MVHLLTVRVILILFVFRVDDKYLGPPGAQGVFIVFLGNKLFVSSSLGVKILMLHIPLDY